MTLLQHQTAGQMILQHFLLKFDYDKYTLLNLEHEKIFYTQYCQIL